MSSSIEERTVACKENTGAVIRDAAGGFIAAAHSYIPHVVDAAMVEARLPLRTVSCWLNRLAATEWKYKLIAWKP